MLSKNPNTLVVDLDGTLLRSDMLYESFWSAIGRNVASLFKAAAALRRGRAALKEYLYDAAEVDVATLPYDISVIDRIATWRAAGGTTALVTASNQYFADAIAEHLKLFDEVHGSDAVRNLKGDRKAEFLAERFGPGSFVYMGDSAADLAVWSRAAKAVTVNARGSLRRKAEDVCSETEHMVTRDSVLLPYLRALRPHQWMKNLLVFFPMLAAHDFRAETVVATLLAFVCFSLIASSVYVLNDLLDLRADRAHPRKHARPFASGDVPIAHGTIMAAGLLTTGTAIAITLGLQFLLVMLGYFILTTAYSVYFKRRLIMDICVLAGLYTMRIIAGGVATGLPLSVWLLAFSMFLFLSLAAVKRQAELVDSAARGKLKTAGRGYVVDDLPIIAMIGISAGYVAVLVMALYVNSPAVTELYSAPEVLWGICAVLLYWTSRMVMIAHRGRMHDDPLVYAARDRVSQVCFVVMVLIAAAGALA